MSERKTLTPEQLEKLAIAREKAMKVKAEMMEKRRALTSEQQKEAKIEDLENKIEKVKKTRPKKAAPPEPVLEDIPEDEDDEPEPEPVKPKPKSKPKKKPIVVVEESDSDSDDASNVVYIKRRSRKQKEVPKPVEPPPPPKPEPEPVRAPPPVQRQVRPMTAPSRPFFDPRAFS